MGDNQQIQPNTSKQSPGQFPDEKLAFNLSVKQIIDSLPIGIIAFNPDLKIIESNPKAEEIIQIGNFIDKSLAQGTDEKIWQNWTARLKECILTGKTCKFDEVEYTSKDKTKLLQIICTPFVVTKSSVGPGGILTIEDVTETANIRNQLTNTERLAAVGKLASKVAHELNNPLDGILRYINLALRAIEQENYEKPQEYLTHCRQGLMRMIQIVKELLEFSRGTYAPLEYVPIEQIIEEALKTMSIKMEMHHVRISRNYQTGLPKIRSSNLFQVFCNLTKNALDAMPDGGEITISTYPVKDNTIAIEFSDTGTGLPPVNTEIIFEPFFTTKEKDQGTGLGLAICRDIVESYHGTITARNAPDGGSIFTVYLPMTDHA
jgi:signal transduction histidine kinase